MSNSKQNDLRKLTRKQLLELLLAQTERADELELQLKKAQATIKDRQLAEAEAGSIAEAALKLNGVFEAAQAAADQYLENIKNTPNANCTDASRIEKEARERADAIIAETERKCRERERQAKEKLDEINAKLEELYEKYSEMYEFVNNTSVNLKETNEE